MDSRYSSLPVKVTETGRKYVDSPIYPEYKPSEDDIYVISTEGDRFDKLSWEFYKNVEYWWVIALVNPQIPADSFLIPPGEQLRIPAYPDQIIVEYNNLNK